MIGVKPRFALALAAAAYVLLVLAASASPGPGAWGLHLPGFLPAPERALVLGLLAAGAGLLVWDAAAARGRHGGEAGRGGGAGEGPSGRQRPPARAPRRAAARAAWPAWTWLLALPALGLAYYALRERGCFMGDGMVWLSILRGGEERAFNEPLAGAAWQGFRAAAHAAGLPLTPDTFALLPVLCGVAAAAIAWGLAGEIAPSRGARPVIWGLLLTTGAAQLWFGYIESYAIAAVPILAFLWLALRTSRGASPGWLAGLALSVAIATHLSAGVLYPALVVALLQAPGPRAGRFAAAALPLLLAPALLLLLGVGPRAWLEPLRVAALARGAPPALHYLERPYGLLSVGHARDVLNAVLLALPVPAILLLMRGLSGAAAVPRAPGARTLATAALPGALLVCVLMLPVAPAQDWDLSALLLLPLGVAGVAAGAAFLDVGAARRARAGLLLLSAGALLSFVLVNADEAAGARRFETLLSPAAPLSPYARAYGNGVLAEYYEGRRDYPNVLRFSRAASEAEPTNPRYQVKLGAALYNLGRYEEASSVLGEALRRGPGRADAWDNLGLCYARTGRGPEAIDAFREAVRLDPDAPDYQHNLGVVLYSAGKLDSARAVWAEVLRRWPGYPLTERSWARRFGPGAWRGRGAPQGGAPDEGPAPPAGTGALPGAAP